MRHRSPSGDTVELRSAASRPVEVSLLQSELEGILCRVAAGLATVADARLLRALLSCGPVNAFVANREFASAQMHATVLLPFYDHYLKGRETDYLDRPAVEYFVRGSDATRSAEAWPPPDVR